ncbi:hypothetical protein HanOQP8_Chr06g0230641 [Helianthus annuus]|nr:hypothetical protein HanIR_Chr06g0291631 [Helianthus annuus]KAJ0738795.1 hypothetical protein HanLR1_Chr06g0222341 [Helianthus annuus]KAJ0741665.1 hypothetical protein HanOQP8_Chr06g0230641 [Helianthus annuus]
MILGVFEESVLKISGGIFGISGGADGARLVERRWWGGGWWGVVQRRKTVVGRWLVGVFATAALDACAPFIRFRRCCRWSVSLFVASSCLDSTNLSSSEVLPVEYAQILELL